MEKTIVVYYSKTGSNKYLAEKIAKKLNCEIEEIKPRLNVFFLLLFKITFGNKPLKHNLKEYDQVVLCGPIWMGKFIAPLNSFVKKYRNSINKFYFVTCCGTSYAVKDEKFGHAFVLEKVKAMMGEKCILCEAFPISLVIPEDLKGNNEAIMKIHLSDENYAGEIQERFENFLQKLTN
jgi:flavodoxin